MKKFNQQPSDKTPPKHSFIKIGLKIFVALTLAIGLCSELRHAFDKPSPLPSSTLEPLVPPHVQAMHDNMSCDALRHYQKWREWDRRGCNK
ncbi:MAG: hypothetical protein V7K40_06240 [Nostoc sp.]|uniref:hypothetical protein n=1 Tax=Nostoc sp. TaxID=1180 RepID=UPI002FFB6486